MNFYRPLDNKTSNHASWQIVNSVLSGLSSHDGFGASAPDIQELSSNIYREIIMLRACDSIGIIERMPIASVPLEVDFLDSVTACQEGGIIHVLAISGWNCSISFYLSFSLDGSRHPVLATTYPSRSHLFADTKLMHAITECLEILLLRSENQKKRCIPCIQFRNDHLGHFYWNDLNGLKALSHLHENPELILTVNVHQYQFLSSDPSISDRLRAAFGGPILASRSDILALLRRQPELYIFSSINRKVDLPAKAITPARKAVFADNKITLLVNLRSGNRQLINQAECYVRLIASARALFDATHVVITGINQGGSVMGSQTSFKELESQELELANVIMSCHSDVNFLNLVGLSLEAELETIEMHERTPIAVAPWGAGLSKYNWMNRLPTLVHSNSHVLGQENGDKMIYHDMRFVDSPAIHRFIHGIESTQEITHFRSDYQIKPSQLISEFICLADEVASCSERP